jgi:biotin carboxyl carrier protein
MKKLRVTVEGKAYEVLVEMLDEPAPSAPRPVAQLAAPVAAPASNQAPAAAKPAAGGAGDVPSPLAGKVVSIDVQIGQTVAEGAQVATVEAMKMNTFIYAPKSGTVAAILVNPGDGVEEGAPLLRLS